MEKEEFLNTKEVAERLNVTSATIYNYVKNKKIKPVYEDWSIDGMMLFYEEDVAKLESSQPNGYTTSEVAKRLGMHQTTISKHIKEGKIEADMIQYRGRMTYFISQETLDRLLSSQQKKLRRNIIIYNSKHDLYLYQSLVNYESNVFGRVMHLSKDGGYIITDDDRKIDIKDMGNEGFTSIERFKDRKYINRVGYVHFKFKKPTNIHSEVFKILEMFYRATGYKNIKISYENEFIIVQIKPILIKGNISLDFMKKHIVKGSLVNRHNGIFLDSEEDQLKINVTRERKNKLKELAKKNHLTIEQQINNILDNELNKHSCNEDI